MSEFVDILRIVQIAEIGRNSVEIAEIFGFTHLLRRTKRFIHLFSVARSDYFDRVVDSEYLLNSLCQNFDSRCGCFLNEQVSGLGVFECKQHQIDSLVQRHHETRHFRHGDSHRQTGVDLVDKQRNNRSSRTHHVTVARRTDNYSSLFRPRITRLGNRQFLHQRFGHTHRIDRISRLIGR